MTTKRNTLSSSQSEGSQVRASEPNQTQPVETKHTLGSAVREYVDSLKPLFIKKNFKNLTKALVATFASLVLLINTKTLNLLGQAAFFTAMVSLMIPPTLPVSLFFMACSTLLLGMLFGWAWGCAAMAAGLRARSEVLLASTYQRVQAGINTNPDATFSASIFAGDFLDPRSSAVHGVFFFFGCFALGAMRAHIPKLSLLSIFGTIVLDVMCSYGPLFPSQQYTIVTIFLIPSSCYVAIGLACTVLIFPESLAHVWLNGMIDGFLKISLELIELQEVILSPEFPLSSSSMKPSLVKGRGLRKKMVAATQGVRGSTGMLDLEPTYGRLGPGDLKKFDSKMSSLMTKVFSLQTFAPIVYDSVVRIEQDEILLSQLYASSASTTDHNKPHSHKHVQNLRHLKLRTQINEKERANGHDLQALLPILRSSSSDLRQSLIDALKSLIRWLELANSTRWSNIFKRNDKTMQAVEAEQKLEMEGQLDGLRQALIRFKEVERKNLAEGPFGKYFEDLGKNGKPIDQFSQGEFSAKSLFVCFVFTTTLESCVEAFISFLELAVQLRGKRPASRFWWPTGFGMLWRKITADDGTRSGGIDSSLASVGSEIGKTRTSDDTLTYDDESEEADNEDAQGKKNTEKVVHDEKEPNLARDPDASPPRTGFQRTGVKLGAFFRWLKSDKGLFSLRYALVSLCLWVIAVHPKTAKFNYENRGLWGLIMAQTGLAVFAGEQIATFSLRISGTIVGLIFGMLAWYIGSGNGKGNPYGVIAATLVILSPWLFMRIALPQQDMMFYMMSGMMVIFVVGYSWIDTHLTVIVNSGVGYEVFWKRLLLVMIGTTAGFVIMCFPKITSARTTVRKTACIINENIAGVFEDEIEIFLLEARYDENATVHQDEIERTKARKSHRMKSLSKKLLETALIMQAIEPSLTVAKFEPQVRGPWPKEAYERLLEAQWKLLVNTALLSGALSELNPHWCSILVRHTPFLNPELITDIFGILSLITQCLYNGHPLPPTLNSLRDRLVYHDRSHSAIPFSRKVSSNRGNEGGALTDTNGDEDPVDISTEKIDGASMGIKDIGLHTLTDPQFPIHATAIISISLCLTQIDIITDIIRELCGETGTFRGFDYWKYLNVKDEEEGLRSGIGGRRKKLD